MSNTKQTKETSSSRKSTQVDSTRAGLQIVEILINLQRSQQLAALRVACAGLGLDPDLSLRKPQERVEAIGTSTHFAERSSLSATNFQERPSYSQVVRSKSALQSNVKRQISPPAKDAKSSSADPKKSGKSPKRPKPTDTAHQLYEKDNELKKIRSRIQEVRNNLNACKNSCPKDTEGKIILSDDARKLEAQLIELWAKEKSRRRKINPFYESSRARCEKAAELRAQSKTAPNQPAPKGMQKAGPSPKPQPASDDVNEDMIELNAQESNIDDETECENDGANALQERQSRKKKRPLPMEARKLLPPIVSRDKKDAGETKKSVRSPSSGPTSSKKAATETRVTFGGQH